MNFDFVLYEGYAEGTLALSFLMVIVFLAVLIWIFATVVNDLDDRAFDERNARKPKIKKKFVLKYLAFIAAMAVLVPTFVFVIQLPQNPYNIKATHANIQEAITETYGLKLTDEEVKALAPLSLLLGYNKIYHNSKEETKLELYGIITTLDKNKNIIKVQFAEVEDSYRLVYADGDPSSLHELEKINK